MLYTLDMLRTRRLGAGYTIVETLIFLAVSSALFVSAMLLISGQQQKTEFANAIRDIDSQIQDVINDIATGYYSRGVDFSCSGGGSGPVLNSAGDPGQGKNIDCIFMGRVIQFTDDQSPENFIVYTAVGLRLDSTGKQVTDFAGAKPKLLAPGIIYSSPDGSDKRRLQSGLRVGKMTDGNNNPITAVGFFSSLSSYNPVTGDINSGSLAVDMRPISPPIGLNTSSTAFVDAFNNGASSYGGPVTNDSVRICFINEGTNQRAILTIGGANRQLSTNVSIESGASCP